MIGKDKLDMRKSGRLSFGPEQLEMLVYTGPAYDCGETNGEVFCTTPLILVQIL